MQQDSTASPSILGMCPYGCKLGHQLVQFCVLQMLQTKVPLSTSWITFHVCLQITIRRCICFGHWAEQDTDADCASTEARQVSSAQPVQLGMAQSSAASWFTWQPFPAGWKYQTGWHIFDKAGTGSTLGKNSVDFKNPPVSYWGCQFQAKLHFSMDNGLGFSVCHIRSKKCSLCIVDNPHTPL